MKKRILSVFLVVFLLFALTGCSAKVQTESKEDNSSMFVIVENTMTWKVVYHKETKVMYAVSNDMYNYGTFTLLVDADGKPMLWEK